MGALVIICIRSAWAQTRVFAKEELLGEAGYVLLASTAGYFADTEPDARRLFSGALWGLIALLTVPAFKFIWYFVRAPYCKWAEAESLLLENETVIQDLRARLKPPGLQLNLTPTAGASPQSLEVTNRGGTAELSATCRIIQLRNDPNTPNQPGTYPLVWVDHGRPTTTIQRGSSQRLLIASSMRLRAGEQLLDLGEMHLWKYSAVVPERQEVIHSCRWNMPQEDLPEYDLAISLWSSNGDVQEFEFTVRPKSWHGGLEMFEPVHHQALP